MKVHFVGVGGVGMSGIARVAADAGMAVSGSDAKSSRYTDQLAAAGVPVFIGSDAAHVPEDADVVVASTAVPESDQELVRARELGIPIWQRARMLAELGRGKRTLAAAGTHGKTTTSSMLATAVDALGLSPTFVVGGMVDAYQTNAALGTGDYYVVEADESDGSFLCLSPYVALVTNVEADHLDHYTGGLPEILETFLSFMSSVPPEGAVVVCGDDPSLAELARRSGRRVVTYGFSDACDARIIGYCAQGFATSFSVEFSDGLQVACRLGKGPGRHNAVNAAGVLSVLWVLGEDVATAAEGLGRYSGVRRRFDLKGEAGGVAVVDDYAHHPTEVAATLAAAKGLGFNRTVVLFQPHRYSRTQALAAQFATAFSDADALVVSDVYSAGEAPIPGVTGAVIADAVRGVGQVADVRYVAGLEEAAHVAAALARSGDLLVTMGAGSVTSMGAVVLADLAGREE